MLQELKRVRHDGRQQKSEDNLIWRTNERVLNGTSRKGSWSMKLVHRIVKKLELKFFGLTLSVIQ